MDDTSDRTWKAHFFSQWMDIQPDDNKMLNQHVRPDPRRELEWYTKWWPPRDREWARMPPFLHDFFDRSEKTKGKVRVRIQYSKLDYPDEDRFADEEYVVDSINGRWPTPHVSCGRRLNFTWKTIPSPEKTAELNDQIDKYRHYVERDDKECLSPLAKLRTIAAVLAVTKGGTGTFEIPIGDLLVASQWYVKEDLV